MDAYEREAVGDSETWDDAAPAGSPGSIAGFDENGFRANVLQAKGPALIVFLSKYSLDSRELEKTLDDLSEKYSERVTLVRYDIDEKPVALKRFKLEKVPALILFYKGEERERLTGKITKSNLSGLLDKYLDME
jgi:thioredoxin 1